MGTEKEFHQAIADLKGYCKGTAHISSNVTEDCKAFERIVSIGYEALPWIRQLFDEEVSDDFPLSIV